MKNFSNKLSDIARSTDFYLKDFFLKKSNNSKLIEPMKYGVFSGGKRFRSAVRI